MMNKKTEAFTLVEMIIAITVFTIFIGFVMGAYLTFHRAQQEAAISRSMMLEGQEVIAELTSGLKENSISYEYYETFGSGPFRGGGLRSASPLSTVISIFQTTPFVETDTLVLRTPGDLEVIEYHWDDETLTLTEQRFEIEDGVRGNPVAGYGEPLIMHSEGIDAQFVSFRLVPGKDPYAPDNILEGDKSLWYQPNVQIKLLFSTPGRLRDAVTLDLQTSVTSRIYQ